MWRLIPLLVVLGLCDSVFAQPLIPPSDLPTWGERLGEGAINAHALRKQVDSLQEEVRRLTGENESLRSQLRTTKQPEPTPTPLKNHATIVTATDCRACPEAKRWLLPWLSVNWEVDFEEHRSMRPGKMYPHIRLCWNGRCEEVQLARGEAVTQENFDRRVREVLGLPAVVREVIREIKPEPRPMWPIRRRFGQNEGHYTPSVVGMTIEYHLTEHHGVDPSELAGKTPAEMDAMHQSKHNAFSTPSTPSQ